MKQLWLIALALLGPLSPYAVVRSHVLDPVLTAEYSPRRALYLAHPWLLWTNVVSDILVALSYALFFFGISWLIVQLKRIPDIRPYRWVLASFLIFIFASGSTVVIRIINVWFPLYQFSIFLKIVCAAASFPTAILFVWQVPAVAARVKRFFTLLHTEQAHAEALRKSEDFLDRTNSIAGIGGWELDIETGTITWSAETYRILAAPQGYQPSLVEGLDLYKPESRPIITAAIEEASAGGKGWDLELAVTRLDGVDICARCVGVVEFRDGKPSRLVGAFQDISARVAERAALNQANERIAIATDSGKIGIWDWDVVTGELFCDAWMHRLHGKDPDSPGADGLWRDHLHPDDRDFVTQALNDALGGIKPYETEFRIIWPDGSIHTLGGSARVTRDETGRPIRMVGANWDITARVEAQNALRTANERLALAADSGAIGIFEWDMESDVCTCDDRMYRLHDLKKTTETTPLEFWTQHMHPDDRQAVLDALEDAVAGPDPYDTEYRVIWNDGSIHYLRGTGLLTRDAKGRAIAMVGANWDVTESRRLTAELAEQHELLRVTLQSIGDGVITVDLKRNVSWLNPAAERMTGWSADQAIGKPLAQIFSTLDEDTRAPAENPLANRLAHGKTVGIARHTLLVSRDGTEFGIENAAAPIRNNFGELLGNVLVFRDVTEQRRLAAETDRNTKLKSELKLKDEFLSHVSHELRSPLTSIYSFTSIIADDLAGETTPEQKEYLHIVLKNVVQLQAMIEDLLTVTQSREGKLGIELQRVPVHDAIADAFYTVQSSAITKRVTLSRCDCTPLSPVYADPTRLRQVLIILLDNAVKFTPYDGSVSVDAIEKEPNLIHFRVIDTGCGIPDDKKKLVFENLYQITGPGHSDTSQAGRTGLGLGLHIARNLITRQGGNIWVTDSPSGGSIFNFTLPTYSENLSLEADNTPRRRKTDLLPDSITTSETESTQAA